MFSEGIVKQSFAFQSNGITRTLDLASEYIKEAIDFLQQLHPSPERDCLEELANFILKRKK